MNVVEIPSDEFAAQFVTFDIEGTFCPKECVILKRQIGSIGLRNYTMCARGDLVVLDSIEDEAQTLSLP